MRDTSSGFTSQHHRLYALGLTGLRACSLLDWDTDEPSLRRENTWKIPGTSGHDLNRLSGEELLVTDHEGVSVFHIPKGSFALFTPLGNVENVKSVNYDPQTQRLVSPRCRHDQLRKADHPVKATDTPTISFWLHVPVPGKKGCR